MPLGLRWAYNLVPLILISLFGVLGLAGCSGIPGDPDGVPVKGIFYFHPDHIGSTKMLTDDTGAVVSRMYYDPYGMVLRDFEVGSRDIYKYKYTA